MAGLRSRRALKRRTKEGVMSNDKSAFLPTAEWLGKFRDELKEQGFGPDVVWELVQEAFREYVRRTNGVVIKGSVDA